MCISVHIYTLCNSIFFLFLSRAFISLVFHCACVKSGVPAAGALDERSNGARGERSKAMGR